MSNTAVEIQFKLHPTPHGRTFARPPAVMAADGQLPRITQIVALALHFQEMIRRGEARDYADLARLGGVTRERLSQVMKLQWLAPDITQQILNMPPTPGGRYPISERSIRRIADVRCWAQQRVEWAELRSRA